MRRSRLREDLGGESVRVREQCEKDVLGADVVVAEPQRLDDRLLQTFRRFPRERRRFVCRRSTAIGLENPSFDRCLRDLRFGEDLGSDALGVREQCEKDVLVADVVVSEPECLRHRSGQQCPRPRSEAFQCGRGVRETLVRRLLCDTEGLADLGP